MFKNFGKDLKEGEFLRVTLTATLIVVGIRFLLYRTNAKGWVQQAIAQSQQRPAPSSAVRQFRPIHPHQF